MKVCDVPIFKLYWPVKKIQTVSKNPIKTAEQISINLINSLILKLKGVKWRNVKKKPTQLIKID